MNWEIFGYAAFVLLVLAIILPPIIVIWGLVLHLAVLSWHIFKRL